jgi:hypothetical protein
MIAAFLIAAAPLPTAVDAELAFARDARRIGQWSAFRKYHEHDAVMFTPQAVWARDFLKDRKDPPKAISWRPAHSWVSCDGRIAVNTGPWFKPDGSAGGYFTTVWQRTKRDWRWVYDGGGPLEGAAPRYAPPKIHRASCRGRATGAPIAPPPPLTASEARTTPVDNGRGESADRTLGWDWKVEKTGARRFRVFMWNGSRYAQVLYNNVPAP